MAVRKRGKTVQKFNYHTHTKRCGHAHGEDREFIEEAIRQGYTTLGFSDHAPYHNLPAPRMRMNWEQLDDYIASITELKKEYEGIIDIHVGLETEFYPEYLDEKKELRDKVEYLILGQHFMKPTGEGSMFSTNSNDELLEYAERIIQAMDTGLYTYLCHPDLYILKQPEFNETCEKVAHMICKKAEETDTPLEMNIHGAYRGRYDYGKGEQYSYPNKTFWSIASQYNVRCLYGIDAHEIDQITDSLHIIEEIKKEMKGLKLHFIRKPII